MQILQLGASILNKKNTFHFLLGAVILISILSFVININIISGDHYTYLFYVKGMHQGRYSYWYFLDEYIPDTFRNPGYPIFLYILSFITESVLFIKIVQLLLLFLTIYLMIKIIERYDTGYILKNIFLFLLLFNFIIVQYPAYIFPETLMLLLITLIVYLELDTKNNSWKKTLLLALLYGYTFQVRPVIIFLPILHFLYYLYQSKKTTLVKNVSFLVIFIVTLLPYGFWNLKHHKQFKITPIEGGAGAMYLGYWSPKMINHVETKYWRNVMYKDILFNFAEMDDVPHNIELFDNEMDSVEQICIKYVSSKDSIILVEMKKHPHLFITNNTKYTEKREALLKELAIKHYLDDWQYSFKLKIYSFFRLWYASISIDEFKQHKKSWLSQTPNIIAFIGTFATLIIFVFYFLYCLWKRRDILNTVLFPILLCLYFDIFHVPFVIQSRYTIPVRLLYLFVLAFMIFKLHFSKKTIDESH